VNLCATGPEIIQRQFSFPVLKGRQSISSKLANYVVIGRIVLRRIETRLMLRIRLAIPLTTRGSRSLVKNVDLFH
jgi:hypothetical protein